MAVNYFQDSIKLAKQVKDLKAEIICLSHLGKIFYKSLLNTEKAKYYYQECNNLVKTLNEFYADGSSYDITKYIDVNKSSVNISLPYREINFQHGDTKTFLASFHDLFWSV